MATDLTHGPTAHYHEGPESVVKYAKENAKRGDPDDVLRAIDEYCWNVRAVMNVGDVKGQILDKIFQETNPSVAIELGSFIGYSAVRMAKFLKPGGKFYGIEINPRHAKLAEEIVEFAGLTDKVTILVGSTETVIPSLKSTLGIDKLDFVFIDHLKSMYKQDLIRLLETGLIQKGSVILADNVIYPGAPDYLKFIRSHPKFKNEYFESMLEYNSDVVDGLEKSVYLG